MLFKKNTTITAGPAVLRHRGKEDESKCSVSGCKEPAVRSLSMRKVQSALSDVDSSRKRAHLCKTHYKEYKKKTKSERDAERWGW